MKKRLALLLSLIALAPLARGDEQRTGDGRVIENPTSNGDIKVRVNVGGTKQDAIAIGGSTGRVTMKTVAGTAQFLNLDTGTGPSSAAAQNTLQFLQNGSIKAYLGVAGLANGLINGDAASDFSFVQNTGGSLNFSTDNGTTKHMSMAAGALTITGALKIGGNTTGDSGLGTIASVSNSKYYEGTFTLAFTGARTTNESVRYTKNGSLVCINFPRDVGVSCTANKFTATAGIPTNLRPANNMFFPIFIQDNGADSNTPGSFQILTSGDTFVNKTFTSSNFTNAANCGYYESSFCWNVN